MIEGKIQKNFELIPGFRNSYVQNAISRGKMLEERYPNVENLNWNPIRK